MIPRPWFKVQLATLLGMFLVAVVFVAVNSLPIRTISVVAPSEYYYDIPLSSVRTPGFVTGYGWPWPIGYEEPPYSEWDQRIDSYLEAFPVGLYCKTLTEEDIPNHIVLNTLACLLLIVVTGFTFEYYLRRKPSRPSHT